MPQSSNLRDINHTLSGRTEEVLSLFSIESQNIGNGFSCPCPVHGGDNPVGFTLYNNGIWRCWTHGCHEKDKHGQTMLGLIHGLLCAQAGKQLSFRKAVEWAESFLGGVVQKASLQDFTIKEFAQEEKVQKQSPVDKDAVASRMIIPSPYFLNRGVNEEVLREFMVGEAKNKVKKESPFYNRAIAPIFDISLNKVCGFTCRTLDDNVYPKWRHYGFSSSQYLYNLERALPHIQDKDAVILVEGPGDVWRLWEAGIKIAVSCFGISIKEGQKKLLEKTGVSRVFCGQDNDGPGDRGAETTKENLSSIFLVNRLCPPGEDWGDSILEDIQELCERKIR